MSVLFTPYNFKPMRQCLLLCTLLLSATLLQAQTNVVTKCFTPAPGTAQFDNAPFGATVGNVVFTNADIPVGHQIVDVEVSITWSKTRGNCTTPAPGAVDLSEVGFWLTDPAGNNRTFAASNGFATFTTPPAPSSTWAGTNQALNVTTVFRDGAANILPATAPANGTFRPNGENFAFWTGNNTPQGTWSLTAIDDLPDATSTGFLCIQSYCVTLRTCPSTLTAVCQPGTVILPLDNTGNRVLNFNNLNLSSDTSCMLAGVTFSTPSFTCANVNTNTNVTMTIQDRLGNTASCNSTVRITDTTRPVITCRNYTARLSAAGTVSLNANDSIIATDNCAVITRRWQRGATAPVGSISFGCADVGLNAVNLVATDAQGNTATCPIFITVQDSTPPVPICRNATVYLDNTGNIGVPASIIDNGSTEVCPPITSYQINGFSSQTYTCANIGANPATLTVADFYNNTASCASVVTVLDTFRPNALCRNHNAFLNSSGSVTVTPPNINNNSTDNCTAPGALFYSINGAASVTYTCTQIGTPQNVTLFVRDASNNTATCASVVTVLDTLRPTALCRNATAYVAANGSVTVPASIINNNSFDNCTPSAALVLLINGSPTATYSCANIGTPQVATLRVTDAQGNFATCTGNITVVDTISPIARCSTTITTFLNAAGIATVLPTQIDSLSSDNCALTTRFINGGSSAAYNCAQVNTTQVANLRVEDAAGNFSVCAANIFVRDTVNPIARCRNRNINLTGTTVVVFPSDIDDNITPSSDNCSSLSYLINGAATATFNCTNVGGNNVILSVIDGSNNTVTCSSVINIQDVAAPVAVCQNRTVYVNPGNSVSILPSDIRAAASSDNCGITLSRINGQTSLSYTCDSLFPLVGTRTAILSLFDAAGNSATCASIITVRDTTRPTASCQNRTIQLNAVGQAVVYPNTGANRINNASADNCAITSYLINGVDSVIYTCANIGANNAILRVSDLSGNTATCNSVVTVQDLLLPTAVCRTNVQAILNNLGQITITATQIDSISADNCAITSRTINGGASVTYTCADIGTNSAILVVSDAAGGTSSCSAGVVVRDTTRPVVNCNAITTIHLPSPFGNAVVLPTQIGTSTDNCGPTILTINGVASATYTCAAVGTPQTATLMATDASGNTATCLASISILDTVTPQANCRNITLTLSSVAANGDTTIFPAAVDNASSDNCNIVSRLINSQASLTFNCSNVGLNVVTLRVQDQSNNNSVCQSNVTVIDATRPVARCQNLTIQLNASGFAVITPASIDNGSTDNCAVSNRTISQDTFRCNNVGANNVRLRVFDAAGNVDSCQAVVTVQDLALPIARCSTVVNAFLNASCLVTVNAAQVDSLSSDNCNINSRTINGSLSQSYSGLNIGANNVILVVSDAAGNTASCPSIIQVRDTIRPTVTCNNITATLSSISPAGVTVTAASVATSSDNCGTPNLTINNQPTAVFSCANIGSNNVTIRATDASGNTVTCAAVVTVRDVTNPVANCQNPTIFTNNNGVAVLTPALVNLASTDNCGISSITISRDTFRCADVGTRTVVLTVRDASNNQHTCNSTVTVRDTTRPIVLCRVDTAYLNAAGTATRTPANIDGGSRDTCGIATRLINGKPTETYDCSQIGLQNAQLTVRDVNNNVDVCNTTVLVLDTIRPIIICQNITRPLNTVGQITVGANEFLTSSSDNCNAFLVTMTGGGVQRNFNCANIGNNNISITARDSSGNVSTCTAILTITDITPPTAQCQNTTVFLSSVGTTNVPAATIAAGSSDACGILSYTANPATVNCSNIGTINVVITVRDSSNNAATCTASITVQDTTPPTVICRVDTAYLSASGTVSVTPNDIDGGSRDTCGLNGLLINNSSNVIFTCTQRGLRNVVLTATDIFGNASSCNTTVLVLDTIRPAARCSTGLTVFLNAAGVVVVPATRADSLSTDNCGLNSSLFRINGQTAVTYTCASVSAVQNPILTVVDSSGNTATCVATMFVRDTVRPIASCRTTALNVNLSPAINAGSAVVNPLSINNNSTDNCGIRTLLINGQASATYTCANRGPNTAILTVIDSSNNQSFCSATININDITNPTARCRNIDVYVDSFTNNGQIRVPAARIDNGSTDNCGVVSWQINNQDTVTYTCANVGANIVTLTVRDSSGNPSTCNAVVTVLDTVRPIARCLNPVNVFLNNSGTISVTGAMIDGGSTDNCGIVSRLINGSNARQFLCTDIGLNNVVLTVSDAAGNSRTCNAVVDVRDTTRPTAVCQNRLVLLSNNFPAVAIVTAASINGTSNDNCGVQTLLINGQPRDTFDCSNVGISTAVLTVIDQSGNQSTCTSSITVTDNVAPTITCTNRVVYLDANGQASVLPTQVGSGTDGCTIITWTINGQTTAAYNCDSLAINVGPRPVLIRATDPSGNFATCNATITVLDTMRPVANCRNINAQLDASGQVVVVPSQIDGPSIDNCPITTYLINNQASQSYNCSQVGVRNALLTVRDASGNQSTCTAVINVQDNIAPVANCRSSITVNLNASTGLATVQATSINNNITPSTDACGPLTFSVAGNSSVTFNCSNVGSNAILLTVTDANGNASQCPSIINVVDNTPPVARCRDTIVYLDNTGVAQATVGMINNNSSDNCGIQSLLMDNGNTINYNCARVGRDTVLLLVTDVNGLTASCPSIIRIVDTVAPVVVCQGTTVDLTQTGQFILTPAMIDPNNASNDACGIDTMFVSPDTITCANFGNIQVVLTAIDINGNIGTCTTTVAVTLDGPTAQANTPLCSGDTLRLRALAPANGNAYTFSWSGPNGFTASRQDTNLINVSGVQSGDYIVTIQPTSGGCAAMDTVTVFVNDVAIPTINADTPACENGDVQLWLSNPADFSGTNISYQWLFNNNPVGVNNDTLFLTGVNASNAGNYQISITVDGCTNVNNTAFNLLINTLPAAPQPTVNAPCEGEDLLLVANPQDITRTYTYQWTTAGYTASAANPIRGNSTQAMNGIYTVLITDNFSCTATANINVFIRETPQQPNILFEDAICIGAVLQLSDTSTYTTTPQSYNWTLADNSTTTTSVGQLNLINATSGTYLLQVDMGGCLSPVDTADIIFQPLPLAFDDSANVAFRDSLLNIDVLNNDIINVADVTISLVGQPGHGVATLNADGTIKYAPWYSFFGVDTIVYQICDVNCPNSCDTALLFVEVVADFECFIPNGLSPNGDGINDILNIRCLHEYPNRTMEIYSRWGNLVYKGNGTDFNGQFDGQDLPDGVYYYILQLNDTTYVPNDIYKGYIIINR